MPTSPKSPTKYRGIESRVCIAINRDVDPTTSDIKDPLTGRFYQQNTVWINQTTDEIWMMTRILNNEAQWIRINSADILFKTLSADTGDTVFPDSNGDIAILGDSGQGVSFDGDNTAKSITGTVADATTSSKGVAQFNPDDFDVAAGVVSLDGSIANTYTADSGTATPSSNNINILGGGGVVTSASGDTVTISLTGGGTSVDSINVDAATAPGTNPVVPDSAGEITVSGAAVDAHSVPVEIHSRAANAYNVEVQVGATVTGAPGNKNKAGLIQLESTHFSVDSDGYADSSVATAVTATPANADGAGIAQFDDTEFTVDSNGFVQLASGVGDGSWVFLASTTASSSSSVVFDNTYINSTYQHYVLVLKRITLNADNHSIRLFFSNDNGATFENTNYAPNTGRIALIAGFGNDTNEYGTSIAHMYDLEDASKKKTVTGYHHYVDNSGIYQTGRVDGAYNVAETINAIEIAPTVTTMNGQIVLYGVKES